MGQLPPDKRKNLDPDFVMAAKGIATSREDMNMIITIAYNDIII
jgi:hypothetical protein